MTTDEKPKGLPTTEECVITQSMTQCINKNLDVWKVTEVSPEEAAKRPPLEGGCCTGFCVPPVTVFQHTGIPGKLIKPDPAKMNESASKAQLKQSGLLPVDKD